MAKIVDITWHSADENAVLMLGGRLDAMCLNLPLPEDYVVNSRGQKIFFRTSWPLSGPKLKQLHDNTRLKAVAIYLHGFFLHGNRPPELSLAQHLAANDILLIAMDFHGHGYSEGVRGVLTSPEDMLDDVYSVLTAVYSTMSPTLPLFVLGHSMGGGVALLLAQVLKTKLFPPSEALDRAAKLFRGCVLFAPLVSLPPSACGTISILHFLFPLSKLPKFMSRNEDICRNNWASDLYKQYALSDFSPPNEGGLSYGGALPIPSLYTFLQLSQRLEKHMNDFSFPIIVLQDVKDRVVNIEANRRLVRDKGGDGEGKKDRVLVEIEGGRHDVLVNRTDLVCDLVTKFILGHIE